MSRIVRAAYWTTPGLLCLALYWLGLKTWFHQDDFAWLNLSEHVNSWRDLGGALFAPRSFGTIRPLSERGFFLALYSLFGLNALPFRIAVFLTQLASLVLISSITRRLSGSALAGFLAPVLWTANSVMAVAMSWTSAYNQVLCGFFLLLSLHLLMRYAETGKSAYFAGQWVSFLAGFGALEVNVIYPVLASSYTVLYARRHFRKTLWLFLPSIAYGIFHLSLAPKPSSGVYALRLDAGMLSALNTYWTMALGPSRLTMLSNGLEWLRVPGAVLLTAALLGFLAWSIRKGRWGVALPAIWFFAALSPYLPFSGHISDYYLTVPLAGLAMWGAWAAARGFYAGAAWRTATAAVTVFYLAVSIPVAHAAVKWRHQRGAAARDLVQGVTRVRELHPDKLILLTGVTSGLFWTAVLDRPFRLAGVSDVYLAPGSEGNIEPHPELGSVADYVLPESLARQALEEGRAVVYDAGGPRLKNVTSLWRVVAGLRPSTPQEPKMVDAGNPLFDGQLGPDWYPLEGAQRWMPKRATVRLGGPSVPGERLYVSGYCPQIQLEKGPLRLAVSVDGHALPAVRVTRGDELFTFDFPLPAELLGKPAVEVTLEVDRTTTEAHTGRRLGLVFGSFSIQ